MLAHLSDALRAIENGEQIEGLDAILLQQVLQEQALPWKKKKKKQQQQQEDPYTTLHQLYHPKKPSKKQHIVQPTTRTRRKKMQVMVMLPPPIEWKHDQQQPTPDEQQEKKKFFHSQVLTTAQLLQEANDAMKMETEVMQSLLDASRALLPLEFLFERNLTAFCVQRSLELLTNVMARFRNRYVALYIRHWHHQMTQLRIVAHTKAQQTIVRVYRGFQARQNAQRVRYERHQLMQQRDKVIQLRIRVRQMQAIRIQMWWRRFRTNQLIQWRMRQKEALLRFQRHYRIVKLRHNRLLTAILHAKQHKAAIKIQKHVRSMQTRQHVQAQVERIRRERHVATIMERNTSVKAIRRWQLERHGAAFVINHQLMYPIVVYRRFCRWSRQLKELKAAHVIARNVLQWFHQPDRRGRRSRPATRPPKTPGWLEIARKERELAANAAVSIQRMVKGWYYRQQYQLTITRQKKQAKRQRMAVKQAKQNKPQLPTKRSPVWKSMRSVVKAVVSLDECQSALKIWRTYRLYRKRKQMQVQKWKSDAKQVEMLVRRRHQAAICIQRHVRGLFGRKDAKLKRAERLLRHAMRRFVWKRLRGRLISVQKIIRWWKQKRTKLFIRLWRLEKQRQDTMAKRLQTIVRRRLLQVNSRQKQLAISRKQEETRVLCEQSLRICLQHVADEIVLTSTVMQDAPISVFAHLFFVICGFRDPTKWKEMDVFKLRMERSKLIALFKVLSKLKKPKVAFATNDVDVAMAKVIGSSKKPLAVDEFIEILKTVADMKLASVVPIWWNHKIGEEAQLLALVWDHLLPLPEFQAIGTQIMAYSANLMNEKAKKIQYVVKKRQRQLQGLLIRLAKQQERAQDVKTKAVITIQSEIRRFLAQKERKKRVQRMYEKYIDPDWQLPYWMNPMTKYATWQKPSILGNEDVCVEPIPFPSAARRLVALCDGKQDCDQCAAIYCFDCDEYFCTHCEPTFHKIPKQQADDESVEGHKVETILHCGLCQFQAATRNCRDCDWSKHEKHKHEALFCDVCFAYVHQRGALQVHAVEPLVAFCQFCHTDPSERIHQSAVQFQCDRCDQNPHVCGVCALALHPIELCGNDLKRLPFENLQMRAYRDQLLDEQEERDRHDIEKIQARKLASRQDRMARKIQKFWHQQFPMVKARRLIHSKRHESEAFWHQYQLDRRHQQTIGFQTKQFFGVASPLPTDSRVMQRLRRMNAWQRRRLEIRARMFGLLIREYVTDGIPLPGVGRLRPGQMWLETSEDLRGWVTNRQTLRLRLSNRRTVAENEQVMDLLMDIDGRKRVEEMRIPLAQAYERPWQRKRRIGNEDDVFSMFLVEVAMDSKRPIWLNPTFPSRFSEWRSRKAREKREEAEIASKAAALLATAAKIEEPKEDEVTKPEEQSAYSYENDNDGYQYTDGATGWTSDDNGFQAYEPNDPKAGVVDSWSYFNQQELVYDYSQSAQDYQAYPPTYDPADAYQSVDPNAYAFYQAYDDNGANQSYDTMSYGEGSDPNPVDDNRPTYDFYYESQQNTQAMAQETEYSIDLPMASDEWQEVFDPSSQQTYYYNPTTQETSWTRST